MRTITEPSLLRAFLYFILNVKHDEVVILEWLIERINSSTKVRLGHNTSLSVLPVAMAEYFKGFFPG